MIKNYSDLVDNSISATKKTYWLQKSLLHHYSRFGVFLFKNYTLVKTVQIGWFAIKIIISIDISSLKKVLQKCENLKKIYLDIF